LALHPFSLGRRGRGDEVKRRKGYESGMAKNFG